MTLPTGIDYTAPLEPFPTSRATWSLTGDRSAVLVHDLQRYFLRPYASACPALQDAIVNTARVLAAARSAGVPVYYTAQQGDQDPVDRGLQGDLWGPGMTADPAHTAILGAVAPHADDVVLVKHRYNAFARSDLAQRLAAQGRDQLVITGVYAHIGITATAFEAFQREVHPFVVADAVADFGPDEHRRALEQVASCCGVVARTDGVVAALTAATTSAGHPWDDRIRSALTDLLPAEVISEAFADADADLFELGLDSLRAFEFLDLLAEDGLDVDFGEFTRTASLAWLRRQTEAVAV